MAMPGALARERAAGALAQVNASSLTGYHDRAARRWGLELVRERPGRPDRLGRPPARRARRG